MNTYTDEDLLRPFSVKTNSKTPIAPSIKKVVIKKDNGKRKDDKKGGDGGGPKK